MISWIHHISFLSFITLAVLLDRNYMLFNIPFPVIFVFGAVLFLFIISNVIVRLGSFCLIRNLGCFSAL